MIPFFQDMSVNPLLLTGLLAGLLASLACGIIGPYVVTRRIVFLSGAIAHMAVGGIGAAIFARHYLPTLFGWLEPFHGAIAVSIAGAVSIGIVNEIARERLDTLIGAMWAIGMAAGILLVRYTPGYHVELMSFLFGNISVVQWVDVYRLLVMVFPSLPIDKSQASIVMAMVRMVVIAQAKLIGLLAAGRRTSA